MRIFLFLLLLFATSAAAQQVTFTYHWRQISGPVTAIIDNPDSATTTARALNVPGDYEFEFQVCNDFGCGLDTCKVTVLPGNVLAIDSTQKMVIPRPKPVVKLEIKSVDKGDEIWFEIKSPRVQKLTFQLFNAMGQLLAKADIAVKTGTNYASLPKPRMRGVYYIRVVSYFENITQKIII